MTKSYIHRVSAIDALSEFVTRDTPASNIHAHKLKTLVGDIKNTVASIGRLHETPNPVETQAGHVKRVATAANKLKAKVTSTREQMHEIMRKGLNDIQSRIDAKVILKADDKYAAEIRAAFRGMKPGEQIAMLSKLARENRGPELAAIINAPALLTGITEEMQARHREQIVSIHAPLEFQEQKALLEALSPALKATDVALEVAEDYSSPNALANIERSEAAAAAAVAAFNDTAS